KTPECQGDHQKVSTRPTESYIIVVRRGGLEPPHLLRRQDLNLVRLPISPPSRYQARYCSLLVKIVLMNPRLNFLHPYPFEKLRALLAEAGTPPEGLTPINLSIGEPK